VKKYVLHPGYVISKTDGDEHWISASRLADLYGVGIGECFIDDPNRPQQLRGLPPDVVHLHPRYDGDYSL